MYVRILTGYRPGAPDALSDQIRCGQVILPSDDRSSADVAVGVITHPIFTGCLQLTVGAIFTGEEQKQKKKHGND